MTLEVWRSENGYVTLFSKTGGLFIEAHYDWEKNQLSVKDVQALRDKLNEILTDDEWVNRIDAHWQHVKSVELEHRYFSDGLM